MSLVVGNEKGWIFDISLNVKINIVNGEELLVTIPFATILNPNLATRNTQTFDF